MSCPPTRPVRAALVVFDSEGRLASTMPHHDRLDHSTTLTGFAQARYAGVDTHTDTHHAAIIDGMGRRLADAEFVTTIAGYQALLDWLLAHGRPARIGIEGTGSYGAGLTRVLTAAGLAVFEVDCPDRAARRHRGKSDPEDAYNAATAVASGRATALPRARTGCVEAIRAIRVARRSAVKARTQTANQIHALLVTAPDELRDEVRGWSLPRLLARFDQPVDDVDPTRPVTGLIYALASLTRRWQHLTDEVADHDRHLGHLARIAAPHLLKLFGVGFDVATQLLVTAGDNPARMRGEAALAHLCGVAPLPASSGRTDRHRLNRGGDRQANKAIYIVVMSRLRHDPETRAYAQRRKAQGLSTKEIMRCLKRHVVRQLYKALIADLQTD